VNIALHLKLIHDTNFYRKSITIMLKKQILSKITNCFKILWKFELPYRGQDESTSSKEVAIGLLP